MKKEKEKTYFDGKWARWSHIFRRLIPFTVKISKVENIRKHNEERDQEKGRTCQCHQHKKHPNEGSISQEDYIQHSAPNHSPSLSLIAHKSFLPPIVPKIEIRIVNLSLKSPRIDQNQLNKQRERYNQSFGIANVSQVVPRFQSKLSKWNRENLIDSLNGENPLEDDIIRLRGCFDDSSIGGAGSNRDGPSSET